MKASRVMVGVMAAGAMTIAGQGSASANIAWCSDDPPVLVQSPTGTNLVVNTHVYVPQSQVHLLTLVTDVAVTSPQGTGTLVTVTVNLPQGITTARVVASVNRFNVSATAVGTGGQAVILHMVVPTS